MANMDELVHVSLNNQVFIKRSRIVLMRKKDDKYELYSTVGNCVIASSPIASALRRWAHRNGLAVNDNLARGRSIDSRWTKRDKGQRTFKMTDLGGPVKRPT